MSDLTLDEIAEIETTTRKYVDSLKVAPDSTRPVSREIRCDVLLALCAAARKWVEEIEAVSACLLATDGTPADNRVLYRLDRQPTERPPDGFNPNAQFRPTGPLEDEATSLAAVEAVHDDALLAAHPPGSASVRDGVSAGGAISSKRVAAALTESEAERADFASLLRGWIRHSAETEAELRQTKKDNAAEIERLRRALAHIRDTPWTEVEDYKEHARAALEH